MQGNSASSKVDKIIPNLGTSPQFGYRFTDWIVAVPIRRGMSVIVICKADIIALYPSALRWVFYTETGSEFIMDFQDNVTLRIETWRDVSRPLDLAIESRFTRVVLVYLVRHTVCCLDSALEPIFDH